MAYEEEKERRSYRLSWISLSPSLSYQKEKKKNDQNDTTINDSLTFLRWLEKKYSGFTATCYIPYVRFDLIFQARVLLLFVLYLRTKVKVLTRASRETNINKRTICMYMITISIDWSHIVRLSGHSSRTMAMKILRMRIHEKKKKKVVKLFAGKGRLKKIERTKKHWIVSWWCQR